jgi:hypothetical protein
MGVDVEMEIVSLLSIQFFSTYSSALSFIRVENINLFTISGFIIKFLLASPLKFLFLFAFPSFVRREKHKE